MKFRTYRGWKKRGRHVVRGETADHWEDGKAMFGKNQTRKMTAYQHWQSGSNYTTREYDESNFRDLDELDYMNGF